MKQRKNLFFADEGVYKPAGIPSTGYFILMFGTIVSIITALKYTETWSYPMIRNLLKAMIIILWILEFCKIAYRFHYGYQKKLNTWVPLYFCSITLFAGLLSAFGNGTIQHIGDVFLCSGGFIGGICFLIYPSTSLLTFPAWHFLSIHSFVYHGSMTYLALLMNRSGLVDLSWNDLIYYAGYVGFFCLFALIINKKTGSNLMFISDSFPGPLYQIAHFILRRLYTPAMILFQMIPPFQFTMLIKYYTPLFHIIA